MFEDTFHSTYMLREFIMSDSFAALSSTDKWRLYKLLRSAKDFPDAKKKELYSALLELNQRDISAFIQSHGLEPEKGIVPRKLRKQESLEKEANAHDVN